MTEDRKSPKDAKPSKANPKTSGKDDRPDPEADATEKDATTGDLDVTPDPATGIAPGTWTGADTARSSDKAGESVTPAPPETPYGKGDTPPGTTEEAASDKATDAAAEERTVADAVAEDAATKDERAAGDSAGATAADPPSAALVPQPETVIERRGGFWPMILGGAVAAGLGFGAAWYYQYGATPRDDLPQALDALRTDLGAQADRIETLAGQVGDLEEGADGSGQEAAQEELRGQMSDLAARLDTLQSRLTTLEDRPPSAGGTSSDADLTALSQRIEAQAAQIAALTDAAEAREAAANASAQATLRRAALTRIQTALDTGSDFEGALSDLEAAGQAVPAELRAIADQGVPTAAQLQDSFPPAARAALAVSRTDAAADGTGGFWAFMGDQLGMRSLEPREGTDPDAVLSRAEAALRDARLTDALAEIDTLPPAAAAEMSDWVARARMRAEALQAAETLAAQLN